MAKLLGIKELCEFWQAIKVLLATKQNTLTAGSNITISGNTISASGEANVQSDWNESDTSSDAYIQNKPYIPSAATTVPLMDGTADVGTSTAYAREDHVHPSDTSKADVADLDDYVEIAGDTMTGDLMIEKSDPRLYTKNPDIDMTEADNGVSATVYNGMRVYDANGKDIGCVYSSATAGGLGRTGLWAYNYDTDGNLLGSNSFNVQVTKSGELTYQMSSPANFCSALGIGTIVSKTVGSSGTTSIPSATSTALTNISLAKGVWVIVGQVSYQGGSSANAGSYRRCHLGTTSTGSQLAAGAVPGTIAGNTQVQAVAIRSLSATTTIYLSAQQGYSSAINVSNSNSWIYAVKIASVA